MSSHTIQHAALWTGVMLGLSAPAAAHNGAVAIAVPVSNITIDGDLSEWPAGMRRYPIALPEYGVRPRDAADLEAFFQLGYDLEDRALYVAVEVRDESIVVGGAAAGWDTQDGCEVYVLIPHRDESQGCLQYCMYGDALQAEGEGARPEHARVAVHREVDGRRYEWRIDLGALNPGPGPLAAGDVLGLDVAVCDADRDGSFSWLAWGKGTAKAVTPARAGDVAMAAPGAATGILRVRGVTEGKAAPAAGSKLRVRFGGGAVPWVDLLTDAEGLAEADLPAGQYRVVPLSARDDPAAGVAVAVADRRTTETELAVPPARGVTKPAGPGRFAKAGPGTRQGSWLTYDASDGLPWGSVGALCPDGRGGLWLGSAPGVTHFDGARFHYLGTEDGLPLTEVMSMALDQRNDLWIGFGQGGVGRYDGRRLTTYTAEDGLEGMYLQTMLADRQGHLWFGYGDGNLSRYDGHRFAEWAVAVGLAGYEVAALCEDRLAAR